MLRSTFPTSLSPLRPEDSGVSPSPNLSHATMDLQMCMPLSLMIWTFTTLWPAAFNISATL